MSRMLNRFEGKIIDDKLNLVDGKLISNTTEGNNDPRVAPLPPRERWREKRRKKKEEGRMVGRDRCSHKKILLLIVVRSDNCHGGISFMLYELTQRLHPPLHSVSR